MANPAAARRRFQISVDLDAAALEALRLELRRLARQHGLAVTAESVQRVASPGAGRPRRPSRRRLRPS